MSRRRRVRRPGVGPGGELPPGVRDMFSMLPTRRHRDSRGTTSLGMAMSQHGRANVSGRARAASPNPSGVPARPVVRAARDDEPDSGARLVVRVAQPVRRRRVEVDGVARAERVGLEADLDVEPAAAAGGRTRGRRAASAGRARRTTTPGAYSTCRKSTYGSWSWVSRSQTHARHLDPLAARRPAARVRRRAATCPASRRRPGTRRPAPAPGVARAARRSGRRAWCRARRRAE